MIVLNTRNVHEALPMGLALLKERGYRASSRNGDVIRMTSPVTTVYLNPMERVEAHAWRDSNPFFHFYESLWMLAGRQDIKPLTKYVSRLKSFSDDGETQNAAYGFRWRNASAALARPVDQLDIICRRLSESPNSRQEVLQIWDFRLDLGTVTKDHACNIAATFQIFENHLDMTVFCRSNDIIWGAYGSNAVHFSMLHEYMARRIGVNVGVYRQISVNYHAYVDLFEKMCDKLLIFPYGNDANIYNHPDIHPFPIAQSGADFNLWDEQCREFVTSDGYFPLMDFFLRRRIDPFFEWVAWPIVQAHDVYKSISTELSANVLDHKWETIFEILNQCSADDWRFACCGWMIRRRNAMILKLEGKSHDD